MRKYINIIVFSSLFLSFTQISFAGISLIPAKSGERQFSFELIAGQEQAANVILENLSDEPVKVHLYGADGTQSNQGTYALTTLSVEQRHIGKWVNFPQPFEELNPRQKKEVVFLIKVPEGATPGVYSGGIAAEIGKTDSGENKPRSGVSISSRIVVKLFVSVPGEKVQKYNWSEFSYKASQNGQKPGFRLSYKNTGNTVILVDQKIEVSGFPIQEMETINMLPATVLGNNEVNLIQKWEDQPFFGFYKATATVTFSEYDIINNKKLAGETVVKEINIYVPLNLNTTAGKITLAIILGILTVLIIGLILSIRKRHFKKNCRPYIVQNDETLMDIAKKYNTHWKKLAKINKLKPPYTLKSGQEILVPVLKESKQ